MHPTAARLQTRLADDGLAIEVVTLTDSARTAALAAAGLGCEVGQIVKSTAAGADRVRAATGFSIAGIPPLIAAIPEARVLTVS